MSAGVAGTTSFRPNASYTTLRDVTRCCLPCISATVGWCAWRVGSFPCTPGLAAATTSANGPSRNPHRSAPQPQTTARQSRLPPAPQRPHEPANHTIRIDIEALSSHARHPRPATSDKQKEVRPSPADSLKESQLAARSGPSPPRRTSPTKRIQTASLIAAASLVYRCHEKAPGYLAPLLRISRTSDSCEILVLLVGEAIFEPANKRLKRVREREGCIVRAESGQLLASCLSALDLCRIPLDVFAQAVEKDDQIAGTPNEVWVQLVGHRRNVREYCLRRVAVGRNGSPAPLLVPRGSSAVAGPTGCLERRMRRSTRRTCPIVQSA
jgi:hypothetical protein